MRSRLKDLMRPRLLTAYTPLNSFIGIAFHISIALTATICIGCSTVEIPDFKAHITLPASGDGYFVKTVSDDEGRIPKAEWDVMRTRGIVVLSEDWEILRFTILKNCLTMTCKSAVGAFDNLFITVDNALKRMQKNK